MLHGATFLSNLTSPTFVPAQSLGVQRNSLPTPGFGQPRTFSKPQASYRCTMPRQVQSHWTCLALGIIQLLRTSARQQFHHYGWSVCGTNSVSLSARIVGDHSHERKEAVTWCTSKKKILSHATSKGQSH